MLCWELKLDREQVGLLELEREKSGLLKLPWSFWGTGRTLALFSWFLEILLIASRDSLCLAILMCSGYLRPKLCTLERFRT
jgi:hypothetical protein